MKKSQLKQMIREEIQKLKEEQPDWRKENELSSRTMHFSRELDKELKKEFKNYESFEYGRRPDVDFKNTTLLYIDWEPKSPTRRILSKYKKEVDSIPTKIEQVVKKLINKHKWIKGYKITHKEHTDRRGNPFNTEHLKLKIDKNL